VSKVREVNIYNTTSIIFFLLSSNILMATFPTFPELIPLELHHGTDPIPAEDPNAPFSVEYQHRKKLYEAYQVLKLRGFTVSEMTNYGCWDKPNAKRSNLDNPIHPLFQLPKWEEGDEKIGPGYAGNWEMRNPIIWDAMEPVLRLATQMFRRAGILPLYVGLLDCWEDPTKAHPPVELL
jgi:hypothetical protein